jgi:5'-nucleotidase
VFRPLPFLLFALTLAGCTVEGNNPDLTGHDVRLTVLHTSDMHSRLLPFEYSPMYTHKQLGLDPALGPFGGLARVATILEEERATAQRSIYVDTGDISQGAPIYNFFGGEAEMRALGQLHPDVVVVGNHEFDRGAENYVHQIEGWVSYPLLAANYDFRESSSPWNSHLEDAIQPWAILDAQGLKIGVIGMGDLYSTVSINEADNSLDVDVTGVLWTVERYAEFLDPLVDIVMVVSHLGLHSDEDIARYSEHVDVVMGGHLHIAMDPPKVIKSEVVPGKQVIVCHSGAFAMFVGRLDLVVRDGEILSHDYELIPVDSTVAQDGDMMHLLEPYVTEMQRTVDLTEEVALAGDFDGDGVVDDEDYTLRRFGTNGGDSPLGSMVAHAMQTRHGVETDFALTNSLGIRTDIQAGPVTREEMFNVLPFDNTIVVMLLSGVEVQELADYATQRSASRGCNAQAQISGARFVMNCAAGFAQDVTVGGSWDPCYEDTDCPANEVCSAEMCGRPIVPEGVYELATNDYIARGGSGFKVLEQNTSKVDTGISMRDAVITYFLDHPNIPADTGFAESDGRIFPVY